MPAQIGGTDTTISTGPYPPTIPGNVGIVLPSIYIQASLPPPTLFPTGTMAFTSDQGWVYISTNGVWAKLTGSSAPSNFIPGTYTFATLPSAMANANLFAITTDLGPAFSNGSSWLLLYNPTNATLGIADNSPLPPAQTGVAYTHAFTATQGTIPFTWGIVSTYGSANTWAINPTTGVFSGTPGSAETDTITVQVVDATGAGQQKTVTLVVAGSLSPAATPTANPAAGTYTSVQSVALSCSTGSSTIYYTTNGSTPTVLSTPYTGPITVNASQTIKAIATAPGSTQSALLTAAYVINISSFVFPTTYARQLNSPESNVGGATWQHQMARYDYAALVAFGGAEGAIGGGQTFASVMSSMKSYALATYNGHVLKTGHERMNQEWLQSTSSGVDVVKTNALNNNVGWALQASGYPSGPKVVQESVYYCANSCSSPWCPTYNIAMVGTVTGPGVCTWQQFCAFYEYQSDVAGNLHAMGDSNSQAANAFADFVDCDNRFMAPRSNGCWQSNATVYTGVFNGAGNTANTVAPHIQQGYADYAAARRALQPGCLIVGNTDYFLFYGSGTNPQIIDSSQLGLYDIALCEAPIGNPNSYATFNTFTNLLNALVSMEQICTPTGKPCFLMEGSGNGTYLDFSGAQSGWTAAQWRAARYQIGIAALLRHYSGIQPQGSNLAYWFDEWDAGVGALNWMGAPMGSRSFTPNSKGIIIIRYTNGTAYLYPAATNDVTTGLSPVTLNSGDLINGGGHHISSGGYGDASVNTGAIFGTLTIQPRDCIFTKP